MPPGLRRPFQECSFSQALLRFVTRASRLTTMHKNARTIPAMTIAPPMKKTMTPRTGTGGPGLRTPDRPVGIAPNEISSHVIQELPPGTALLLGTTSEAFPALDLSSAATRRRRTRNGPLVAHSLNRHAPNPARVLFPAPVRRLRVTPPGVKMSL